MMVAPSPSSTPDPRYLRQLLGSLTTEEKATLANRLPTETADLIRHDWEIIARDNQLPPPGDWSKWMILAGRGFGKSRSGAEWATAMARQMPGSRGAMVARTAADTRDVMVEGESGLLAIAQPGFEPEYQASKRRVVWPNGSMATLYSGEKPDALRGPQHHWAWADELASWQYPEAWDMLMFGLRLGAHPRAVITTTPRAIPVIKELVKDPDCVTVRGSTYENRANLAPTFFTQIVRKYEGTRLGRQELLAEILDDNPGALWNRALLEQTRVHAHPPLKRIAIGVDPEASSGEGAAETGIVVAGVGIDGHGYVLGDATIRGTPYEWGRQVVGAYGTHAADIVVVEMNQGGEMASYVIQSVDPMVNVKGVHATRGKQSRAEPVAALYEQNRVHHVGMFAELEDQLCEFEPDMGLPSPDRLDALVWAITELMLNRAPVSVAYCMEDEPELISPY